MMPTSTFLGQGPASSALLGACCTDLPALRAGHVGQLILVGALFSGTFGCLLGVMNKLPSDSPAGGQAVCADGQRGQGEKRAGRAPVPPPVSPCKAARWLSGGTTG